jgi:hypothetical protein
LIPGEEDATEVCGVDGRIHSDGETSNAQRPTSNCRISGTGLRCSALEFWGIRQFIIERWTLDVGRWTFPREE